MQITRRNALTTLALVAPAVAIGALPALAVTTAEIDWPAALARVEQIIEALRESYVCEGWQMDESASADALAYFRDRAVGGAGDEAAEWKAMQFIINHGQSLDWVFSGDPIFMICHGALRSRQAARIDHGLQVAIDDLQAAAKEAYPQIKQWKVVLAAPGDDLHCPFMIAAFDYEAVS